MVHGVNNNHGKGLGAGSIPPGIQKKLDNNSLPGKLMEKFPQLGELLSGKTQPLQKKETAATTSSSLPQGILSQTQLREMVDAPYPTIPPIEALNPGVDSSGLPTLKYLA